MSLAGVGGAHVSARSILTTDLFLTCSSESSRNFTVGLRLGQGETLQHIIDTLGSVAEGVETTKGLRSIIRKHNIHAPIAEQVWEVLYGGVTAKECVKICFLTCRAPYACAAAALHPRPALTRL